MSAPDAIEIYNSARGFDGKSRDVITCRSRRQQRCQGSHVVIGRIGRNAQAMLNRVARRSLFSPG
jgi:hypothetical protein